MVVLIKNISTYQKTKNIYRGYIKAKNKEAYKHKHESSLILYEAATKALKDAGIKKLPDMAALKTDYAELQAQKETLYEDYGKLKKQIREYEVIKRNIDSLL